MIDPNDDRTQNEKDLTMLVLRLVRRLDKLGDRDPISEAALDFLRRNNFARLTDVLR